SIASGEVDIHHAGTAMRFLTAYFAAQEGKEVVLTGSERMKERPIKVLVEALQDLGAQISYKNKQGYPPLHITGKKISKHKVRLPANVSSQYISALLLIAPSLENGLELELVGEITSVPYIKMTLELLEQLGIATTFQGSVITVQPKDNIAAKTMVVESDWSSVSYFYGILALAEAGSRIVVSSYKKNSLQGDSVLADIYTQFGVVTHFEGHHLVLEKTNVPELPESSKDKNAQLEFHLANAPDIAQTIAVTCFGLGLGCHLTGLHTLKIKETDRLEALKTELTKLGATIHVTDKDLTLEPSNTIHNAIQIETYNDHRMAMAFAPLALKTTLIINDAGVVSKSYPDFWNDLGLLNIQLTPL
ncbi:MAG: 3-phosphoshikimate 1-carboxyvinyltransferase, partial [Flavobacteriaceae bacterium]|nr:3-phosphoshikimate 1-carboxyvinyltransferase [Flavobacteriaceae bacterium]